VETVFRHACKLGLEGIVSDRKESRYRFPRRRYRRIYLLLTVLRDQGRSIHRSSGTSHMDQNLENLIRERAYEIWTSHGCVHGHADQHWLAAEREILTASAATLPGKPGPQKKRPLPARSKITKTLARAG
jgi:Protein of unknown function (DUF2934)